MADAEGPRIGTMLLVLCEKRHVQTILQEFEDWNEQEGLAVKVLLYGITQKAHDRFLLVALTAPLSEGVYTNLVLDDDIVDYIQYSPLIPTLPPPT